MVTRKYVKDYKFSESVTEGGKIKTEAVYVGDYFRFVDPKAAAKIRKYLLPLTILAWILYIIPLFPLTAAMHLMYVALPYAFAALPLGYLTASAVWFLRDKEPLVRSQADKISTRIPICTTWTMILTGIALVGEIVTAIADPGRMLVWDIAFSVCTAAVFGIAVWVFSHRADLKTKKTEKK